MKPIGVEIPFRCWPQPHVIIYAFWHSTIGDYGHWLHPPLICPCFSQPYLTQLTRMYIIYCIYKMGLTSLPLSYWNEAIARLDIVQHNICLLNGVCNGLFTIHIFPSL